MQRAVRWTIWERIKNVWAVNRKLESSHRTEIDFANGLKRDRFHITGYQSFLNLLLAHFVLLVNGWLRLISTGSMSWMTYKAPLALAHFSPNTFFMDTHTVEATVSDKTDIESVFFFFFYPFKVHTVTKK